MLFNKDKLVLSIESETDEMFPVEIKKQNNTTQQIEMYIELSKTFIAKLKMLLSIEQYIAKPKAKI